MPYEQRWKCNTRMVIIEESEDNLDADLEITGETSLSLQFLELM